MMSNGWLWDDQESDSMPANKPGKTSGIPKPEVQKLPGVSSDRPLTVSQLNQLVKGVLEDNLPGLWIEAEVSDLARPQSGHLYLTLKDAQSQIKAVMWRGTASKLPFQVEDGQSLICFGNLDVYSPRGTYQFIIQRAQPKGVGPLQLAFQQLHARLSNEGLFRPERKKNLPPFPRRIGFVTSPSGAAVRDFLEVLRRRWQGVEVLIIPAKVQGKEASKEIVEGIRLAAKIQPKLDVLVVGRGGGSLEDLWSFNEEPVVRAVAACPIPTVSAVGHEVDVTLCDLAADVRALTPTEAAERIFPDRMVLVRQLHSIHRSLTHHVSATWNLRKRRLEQWSSRPVLARPNELLRRWIQRLDEIQVKLDHWGERNVDQQRKKLERLAATLDALSPLRVLARGYSVTQNSESKSIIASVSQLRIGQSIETRLPDGRVFSQVQKIEPDR